jgi:hypothetical protein
MMVRRPGGGSEWFQRRLGFVGLGAADPSWFGAWTSSGHNGESEVLSFISLQPSSGVDPHELAARLGVTIPDGGGLISGRPTLAFVNPPSTGGGTGNLYLDAAMPPWFVHPGDDVMAAAIRKWVEPWIGGVEASTPTFSQAVPVLGGQTPAQAAAVQAINAQNLSNAHAAAAAGLPASASVGLPAASSATSISDSVPVWAWLLGAAALAWFLFRGGSNG